MIDIYGTTVQLAVTIPPVVKWIGYIRYGGISIDATFDLSNMHPSQHELALRVISMRGGTINNPRKAPKDLIQESPPWWKFWK